MVNFHVIVINPKFTESSGSKEYIFAWGKSFSDAIGELALFGTHVEDYSSHSLFICYPKV
jgi:hypothetical protein